MLKLATEAGVSQMTVSKVINNRAGVSEEVRARILALQQKYKFTTKYQGSKTKISVVITDPGITDYYKRIINSIMKSCRQRDIEVTMVLHDPKYPDLVSRIRDLQRSGLIIPLGGYYTNQVPQLLKSRLPVVMIDINDVADGIGYVDNDSYSGAYEATRYLIEMGHKSIGFLHYKNNFTGNHSQRYNAYCKAMQEAGIEIRNDLVVSLDDFNDGTQSQPAEYLPNAVEALLSQKTTAIMVIDDYMALKVMGILQRKGVRIPEDISITGFDNHSESSNWFPALTTVSHDLEGAAEMAVDAIEYAIAHPGNWNLPRKIMPTKLIVRESTGKVRK